MHKYFFWAICALLLTLVQCAADTEQVDTKDEFGNRTVYQRRVKDGKKEGVWESYDAAGRLMERTDYHNDSIHGLRRLYYESGQLMSEESFQHGVNEGPYRKYFENGVLMIEQTYRQGAMEGLSIRYYPNGQVMETVSIVQNEENGPFKEFYENGRPKAEGRYIYANDAALEHGELKEYDTTGVLIRVAQCDSGFCHTIWRKQ